MMELWQYIIFTLQKVKKVLHILYENPPPYETECNVCNAPGYGV